MVAFGHSAIGTGVGLVTYHYLGQAHPYTGLLVAGTAGVISHYLADCIPHGHFFVSDKNYKRNIILTIIFDFMVSVLLFTGLEYLQNGVNLKILYILFGIGGAQLPDIIDNLYHIKFLPHTSFLKTEHNFHMNTHWHGKLEKGLPIGWYDLWQVTAILTAIWVVLSF